MLPLEARGLYREMLTQAWRRGAQLPDNHEAIRRATGSTLEEWQRCWPLVERYWREESGRLVNDTQLEVYAEAKALFDVRSAAGKKGNGKRWASQNDILRVAKDAVCESPPSPSPKKDLERESTRARFERWWDGYPKKVGKDAAWTEFSRLAPDDHLTDIMIAAVSTQRASAQWRQDNGRYIPHPKTWLHQGRWQDDMQPIAAPVQGTAVDWWDECKAIHAGACTKRWDHEMRKRTDAAIGVGSE